MSVDLAYSDVPPTGFVPPPAPADAAAGYTDEELKLVASHVQDSVGELTCRARFLVDDSKEPSTVLVILDRVYMGIVFKAISWRSGSGPRRARRTDC